MAPSLKTIGQLDKFWDCTNQPLDYKAHQALIATLNDKTPPPDIVIFPAGRPKGREDAEIETYPLRPRSRNALMRHLKRIPRSKAITVGDLLQIPYFGITSLIDVMCVVETVLAARGGSLAQTTTGATLDSSPTAEAGHSDEALRLLDQVERLLIGARDLYGVDSVGEAFRLNLGPVAEALGIDRDSADLAIDSVTTRPGIGEELSAKVAAFEASLSEPQRLVLKERMYSTNPRSIADIGRQRGVTYEAIRRLQLRLAATVESELRSSLESVASLLRLNLSPVIASDKLDAAISGLFGTAGSDLARRMVKQELDYADYNGICFDPAAREVVSKLRCAADASADDVGIVNADDLRTQLPDGDWDAYWQQLLDCCGLHEILGQLALRDTAKARAKAAVIQIGRLATKEEIAAASGLDPARVGSQLSGLPGVARADKHRWGLLEWIDDIYEGIPAEITQRIAEDGDATPLARLLEEIPRLFGVRESSVRSYVATPQFVVRDGYVSIADPSSFTFRDIEDVISGRDATGAPYWEFTVEERYFSGYSILGFPPELANELGCRANERKKITLTHPPGCGMVSVVWRLSSQVGASVGHVAEPLRCLGAEAGDTARIVITGARSVALRLNSKQDMAGASDDPSADALLERMKSRRRIR